MDGQRLKQFLADHGISQRKLATAAQVADMSVVRWTKTEAWSRHMWQKIEAGIKALGLDPEEIRPPEMRPADLGVRTFDPSLVIATVDRIEKAGVLPEVGELLTLSAAGGMVARAIIEDRLHRKKA